MADLGPYEAVVEDQEVVQRPSGATVIEKPPPIPRPTGATPLGPKPFTIGEKIGNRFLGTDVEDDPLALPRLGTTITGGIVGGITGTKTGAAIGAYGGPAAPYTVPIAATIGGLGGGALGSLAGAIAPEAFLEAGEELGILEEGTRKRLGASPEELRTIAEGEALLDLATGGGLTVLRGAGRGTATIFTGARKALAQRAAAQGIDMMPVQVGDRVIGRGFVSVFGRFPLLGGGAIRRRGASAEEQMRGIVTGLAARTGPITDASKLGEEIFKDATNLVTETNRIFGKKYDAVFAQADELGIHVVPKETLTKADEILAKLLEKTPAQIADKGTPGPALQKVSDFIEESIQPLRAMSEGSTVYANQSLRQMDGLIEKIDQQIATLEPGQKRFALSLLLQLRQAAQRDVLSNVRGINADEIARALKAIDTEFSHTMSQLFETATAKRFGTVTKRGLRATVFDSATRTPVDQLARVVINLNSPQSIDELARLIHPDTLRMVASHTIDNAVQMSMKTDGFVGQFDVATFARRLGLDGTNEARKKTIARMLEKSGAEFTINDLDDIVEAGRALSNFDIPNVSSFIARRGTIGGLQSIINGVVPGLALLGGSGAATAFSGSSLVGAILFIGGSHLFARIISNPLSARALHEVFQKEATTVVRRKAMVQALRGGITEMYDLGEITSDTYTQLLDATDKTMEAFDKHYESMQEEQ